MAEQPGETPPAEGNERKAEKPFEGEQPLMPFYERSEIIRSTLGIAETVGNWKKIMTLVTDAPKLPEQSGVDEVSKQRLRSMYGDMERRVGPLRNGLNLLVTYDLEKRHVEVTLKDGVLRELAQFISLRRHYDDAWKGDPLAPERIETYFVPYVENTDREKLALLASGVLFQFQYDVLDNAGVDRSPIILSTSTQSIASGAIRNRVKMTSVNACIEGGAVTKDTAKLKAFLVLCGFKEADLKDGDMDACKLLVGFLLKYKKSIELQAKLRTEGNVDALTVAEALEATTGLPEGSELSRELINSFVDMSKFQLPDMRNYVDKLFREMNVSEKVSEAVMGPLADLAGRPTKQEADEFRGNAKAVTDFCMISNGAVEARLVEGYWKNTNAIQKQMIQKLLDHVTTKEMKTQLAQSVFIDPEERGGLDGDVNTALSGILDEKKITLREAYEIYYITHEGGNGLVLSYKTIDLLNDHGHGRLANKLQFHVLSSYASVVAENADDVAKLAEELNMSDEQVRELGNFRRYMQEKGVNIATNIVDYYWNLHIYFPWLAAIIDAPIVSGVAYGGYRGLITVRWRKIREFAEKTDTELETMARTHNIDLEQMKAARTAANELYTRYQRSSAAAEILRLRNVRHPLEAVSRTTLRGAQLRAQASSVMRSATAAELGEFAKAIKKSELATNIDDVTRRLYTVSAEPEVIARALHQAGYSQQEIIASVRKIGAEKVEAIRSSARSLGISDAELANAAEMALEVEIDPKTFTESEAPKRRWLDIFRRRPGRK